MADGMQPISPVTSAVLLGSAVVLLLWAEYRRPLRVRREPPTRRRLRNLAIAATAAVAVIFAETPLIAPLARHVEEAGWGFMPALGLPPWAEAIGVLLLMDYTFYIWHVLLHRVGFLWRFHAVHHVDRDLDASTAIRFHFGELLLSMPWRAMQVAVIGLNPYTFSLWQLVFGLCVLFHHSNAELPLKFERALNYLLVTPRMHGIHHSNFRKETDSNWSSGLTCWDWLHGTLRLNIPQRSIVAGVPAFENPSSVTLPKLMTMPFAEQPDHWTLPSGDERIERPHPGPSGEMSA